MVSFGAENEVIAANLWERVWREQLRLTNEQEFWTGLEGKEVNYAIPPAIDPHQPLPAYLQRFLRDVLHWPETRIAYTPREHAQDLLNEYFASDGSKADQDGDED